VFASGQQPLSLHNQQTPACLGLMHTRHCACQCRTICTKCGVQSPATATANSPKYNDGSITRTTVRSVPSCSVAEQWHKLCTLLQLCTQARTTSPQNNLQRQPLTSLQDATQCCCHRAEVSKHTRAFLLQSHTLVQHTKGVHMVFEMYQRISTLAHQHKDAPAAVSGCLARVDGPTTRASRCCRAVVMYQSVDILLHHNRKQNAIPNPALLSNILCMLAASTAPQALLQYSGR
jgi:hypothetical protein